MKKWLTGEDLFNWMSMLRTTDQRTFVVLEGPTDCQALDPHVADVTAATFPAHSKSVAKRALELIDDREMERVLVVLDRDWVDVLEARVPSPNVVYTDDYDLDATILFAGDVLGRVVSTHSDRDQRDAHLGTAGATPDALIAELAGTVGLLRFASERDRLGMRCGGFPLHQAIASSHDRVDLQQFAVIAVGRSAHRTVGEAAVVTIVERERQSATDLRWFCNGHDLASGLSSLITRWGGSTSRLGVEQAVRSTLSCADLKATQLYRDVLAWSSSVGTAIWSCA